MKPGRAYAQAIRRVAAAFAMAALASMANAASAGEVPRRVVSMNLCTDQLAMLLAEDGQLHSVSHLATDPEASVLAVEARGYRVNHGLAEEVFLMRPDLVLAGAYTTRATVALLRRLGFRAEEFEPEASFDDVRANIRRMGALLGHQERAEAMVAALDRDLAEASAQPSRAASAALYSSNSYVSGSGTLADAALGASGLDNVADMLGIKGAGRVPLEALIMADPDLVVTSESDFARPALAQENFRHPAFRALSAHKMAVSVPDKLWICGAPFTVEAVRILRRAAAGQPIERGDAR